MKHYNLLSLFDDFERDFLRAPAQYRQEHLKRTWSPSSFVDVQENHYLLTLDLPGVDSEHLKVDLGDKEITISGERNDKRALRNGEEFFKFTSRFSLPEDVNQDEVDVLLENGVLEVTLPKISKKSEPRTLTIRKGSL